MNWVGGLELMKGGFSKLGKTDRIPEFVREPVIGFVHCQEA